MKKLALTLIAVAVLLAVLNIGRETCAQQVTIAAELPDAPAPSAAASGRVSGAPDATPRDSAEAEETHLSFVPSFRPLSAGGHPAPQSLQEKFLYATEDNIDVFSIGVPALSAGYKQLTKASPEFGTGPKAYGRYYWHSWVDRASENYCVEFIVPAIAHEDPRYYSLGRSGGSAWRRISYAVTRVLVTRSDSGGETFNVSEVVGAGMAGGLANLYYPHQERSFSHVGQRWGENIGFDAAGFLLREFWPDINHRLFHAGSR